MELIYLWMDGYNNLRNKGVLLNSNFIVDLDDFDSKKQKRIFLFEKKGSVEIFGNNLNIMTIVGKNGSGKTNILIL